MDLEREKRLDEIDFDFNPKGIPKENWNLQFQNLEEYFRKHGHCELFWTVDRFIFILNTLTNNPPVCPPAL
jgi:hypothetical protein